jgi:4-diphosphocytidyl-2-C-methyl-D-erythritol kinase
MTKKTVCPAKINSFLTVGPPDAGGLHPIRTVFRAVSLADELSIAPADRDEFVCFGEGVPEDNTVTKAWRLAKEHFRIPPLRVTLVKRIPSQSGLGGGSSDAAALLRLLAIVSEGLLDQEALFEVAAVVGADVPFFLLGGSALGEGYGERLSPLPDEPRKWILIAQPPVSVPTAQAYRDLDVHDRGFLDFPQDLWSGHNDFLLVAPDESRQAIGRLKELGAHAAGLSGSGSAVYGVFDTEELANRAAAGPIGRCATWLCHTLTRDESLWTS